MWGARTPPQKENTIQRVQDGWGEKGGCVGYLLGLRMSRVGWGGENGGCGGGAAFHTKRKYKGLEMARVRGV